MLFDADAAAAAIREEAGLDEAAGPVALAWALMGENAVLLCHRLPQKAVYKPDTDRIWLRRELSITAVDYLVGHEIAERYQHRSGQRVAPEEREAFCDAVAARLVASDPLVRAAMRIHRDDHFAVAVELRTTQTIALVRMAEVARRPLVAVLPGRLIVRGDEFEWGDEATVRRFGKGHLPEGIERRDITDARGRFGLIAA